MKVVQTFLISAKTEDFVIKHCTLFITQQSYRTKNRTI